MNSSAARPVRRADGRPARCHVATVAPPDVSAVHEWVPARPPCYVDSLTLRAGSSASARSWARTMFEEVIRTVPREIVFFGILGLWPSLRAGSIAGWRVVEEEPECVRMVRGGMLMAAELVLTATPETVCLALTMRPHHRLGLAVWQRAAPVHRAKGCALLQQAWRVSPRAT